MAWSGPTWLIKGSSNRLVNTAVNEGKRPFGKPGYGWEDDIKVGLMEIWHGVNSAGSVWSPVTDKLQLAQYGPQ
jgi:hypothetical protein